MGITVGDIYTQFPSFKPEDMATLVGSSNYNGRTQISLRNIANYNGQFAKDLSVFVAKKEKNNFTKLLATNERNKLNQKLGINNENQLAFNNIPMNRSIFDIERPNNQYA